MDTDDSCKGIFGFCWAADGRTLLVQHEETITCYSVEPELLEIGNLPMERASLLGFGHSAGDWWILTEEEGGRYFRRGLHGESRALDWLVGGEVSLPSLSPDGQTLACVIDQDRVVFWSMAEGKFLFVVRVVADDEAVSIFGPSSIVGLQWSSDSRHMLIEPGDGMESLFMVDVAGDRILGTIG